MGVEASKPYKEITKEITNESDDTTSDDSLDLLIEEVKYITNSECENTTFENAKRQALDMFLLLIRGGSTILANDDYVYYFLLKNSNNKGLIKKYTFTSHPSPFFKKENVEWLLRFYYSFYFGLTTIISANSDVTVNILFENRKKNRDMSFISFVNIYQTVYCNLSDIVLNGDECYIFRTLQSHLNDKYFVVKLYIKYNLIILHLLKYTYESNKHTYILIVDTLYNYNKKLKIFKE